MTPWAGRLQQLIQRDGQVPDPLAGGVIHRIGNGGRGSGDPNLSDAVRTGRRVRIGDVEKIGLDFEDIQVHGT